MSQAAEPLRSCHRPWLNPASKHYSAVCPLCRSGFEFLASEATVIKHKERGECFKLACPVCGAVMAREVTPSRSRPACAATPGPDDRSCPTRQVRT